MIHATCFSKKVGKYNGVAPLARQRMQIMAGNLLESKHNLLQARVEHLELDLGFKVRRNFWDVKPVKNDVNVEQQLGTNPWASGFGKSEFKVWSSSSSSSHPFQYV